MADDALKRQVTKAHFDLLKNFGRSAVQQNLADKDKDTLWRLSCQTARIAHVPLDTVVLVWKDFIGGESSRSGLAINGDIDPNYTTLGVTFDRLLVATHTTTTRALLERVLKIWRRGFSSDEDFMESVRGISAASLQPPKKKGAKK
jgi:hypothetical protein